MKLSHHKKEIEDLLNTQLADYKLKLLVEEELFPLSEVTRFVVKHLRTKKEEVDTGIYYDYIRLSLILSFNDKNKEETTIHMYEYTSDIGIEDLYMTDYDDSRARLNLEPIYSAMSKEDRALLQFLEKIDFLGHVQRITKFPFFFKL